MVEKRAKAVDKQQIQDGFYGGDRHVKGFVGVLISTQLTCDVCTRCIKDDGTRAHTTCDLSAVSFLGGALWVGLLPAC